LAEAIETIETGRTLSSPNVTEEEEMNVIWRGVGEIELAVPTGIARRTTSLAGEKIAMAVMTLTKAVTNAMTSPLEG